MCVLKQKTSWGKEGALRMMMASNSGSSDGGFVEPRGERIEVNRVSLNK